MYKFICWYTRLYVYWCIKNLLQERCDNISFQDNFLYPENVSKFHSNLASAPFLFRVFIFHGLVVRWEATFRRHADVVMNLSIFTLVLEGNYANFELMKWHLLLILCTCYCYVLININCYKGLSMILLVLYYF